MFTSVSAFLQLWEKESELTQQILDGLTEGSLKQSVTQEDRTIGRLAWHIVTTIPEMMSKTGLIIDSIGENAPIPNSAKEIAASYHEISNEMVIAIRTQWDDQTLLEERDMYGETWTIGVTLNVLINHQIHHRGQMTILMRQAGLRVPGIYGPSREEWTEFGMEPPEV